MAEGRPPAAFVPDAMTETERRERGDEAERDGDRPRQREAEARMRRPARENNHRRERGGGRKDRVLERAEPEHADARFTRLEPRVLERVTVDDEAATNNECPETRGDDCAGTPEPEPRTALDARDLAVGDDVAEVRSDLHAEGDRQPDRIHTA